MRRLTWLCLALLLALSIQGQVGATGVGTLMPDAKRTFLNNNSTACNGCLLFFYASGGSTKQTAYADANLSSALANPTTLDSAGRVSAGGPYLVAGSSYKLVLAPSTDTDPPASPIWSQDLISAVPPSSTSADVDVTATAGATIASGDLVCLSDGGGGNTAGRFYPCDADFTYLSNLAPAVGFATTAISTGSTGTVKVQGRMTGLTGLVAGTLYYASATAGALTSTKPTNARAVGTADSTTTVILSVVDIEASSAFSGLVSTGAQTFAGIKTLSSAPVLSLGATFASTNTLGNVIKSCSTANFTKNNNTTLGDVTSLSFAVEASSNYVFLFLLYGFSGTTPDFKFTLTGPAAPTAVRFGTFTETTTGAASVAAFSSNIFNAGTGADEGLIIHGTLRNGANAGTVQLQMAQSTADVSNTIIYAESCVLALKI